MKTKHVFPIRDSEPHFFHGTCLCLPTIEDEIIIHNTFEEMEDQKWTWFEFDDTMIVEYSNYEGWKMTQYVDVDGNLQEEFE